MSWSKINFHRMHTPFCDCTEAAAARQSPFKYVECFQLQRASELPKWDFRRWASSACVCTMGRIKARSTVLISDTDYDLGFYERLRYCQMQYLWQGMSAAFRTVCSTHNNSFFVRYLERPLLLIYIYQTPRCDKDGRGVNEMRHRQLLFDPNNTFLVTSGLGEEIFTHSHVHSWELHTITNHLLKY